MGSTTSSFRVRDDLRLRLEETARHLRKTKNWIITRALEEYLEQPYQQALIEEARRQSLEASRAATTDEDFWAQRADRRGWR